MGPTGGRGEVDLSPPRLTTGSTPDLHIGASFSATPGTSTAHDQRPNGMQTVTSLDHPSDRSFLHDLADHLSIPDRFRSMLSKRQSKPTESSNPTMETSAGDGAKLGWKTATSSATKLLLLGVRDSADAFGPLKSVVGGLYFILENCEVRTSFYICCSHAHG